MARDPTARASAGVGTACCLDGCPSATPMLCPAPTQILFVITNPDVFKSPASDTYIIFGEVRRRQQRRDSSTLGRAARAHGMHGAGSAAVCHERRSPRLAAAR